MRFEFATAVRIVFGPGTLRDAGRLIHELVPVRADERGSITGLMVTGASTHRGEPLRRLLEDTGYRLIAFAVSGEPTVESARRGAELLAAERCSFVVGLGGGSVIDTGKTIAALAANPGDPLEYLEVVGRGKSLANPSLPYAAVPTTAGTGAEVTRNAVLASPEHKVKVSLRSPYMLPRLALVDPQLTHSLPPAVTAATGLDALTQLIEPFVSHRANPMTDAICREGIARAARSLRRAFRDGGDPAAREDMSLAALFGGLALANAGLGAVHGFAGPVGGEFPAPHGAVCAALLPHVMAANLQALKNREPANPALDRYAEVARILTGRPTATAHDGVEWVERLVADLGIPPLRAYGLGPQHADALVRKASAASSMKGNPIRLTPDELKAVLLAAID